MSQRLRGVLPHFVMLLMSLALYWAAGRIEGGSGGRIGPDVWPKAVIVFMGLLCVYEIVKRLVVHTDFTAAGLTEGLANNPAGEAAAAAPAEEAPAGYPPMLWLGGGLIIGYVLAVPWLGFFVTTALFLGGFAWIGGFRRPPLNLLIGALGAFVLVVAFMRVAYISLPLGVGVFHSLSVALLALIGVK